MPTRDELLTDLRRVVDEIGVHPTASNYREYGTYSVSAMYQVFGSWEVAKNAAGVNYEIPDPRKINREDLLEDLSEVAEEVGHPPTGSEYRTHGTYSFTALYREFDTLDEAREAAGLEGEVIRADRIPKEDLLQDIQRADQLVDDVVTYAEYRELGNYSVSTVESRFDGWPAARKAAGIEGTPTPHNHISQTQLEDELHRLTTELDRTPRRQDIEDHGRYSYATFERTFGGWNKALTACGYEVNQPTKAETVEKDCDVCGVTMTREKADIAGQENVFCSRDCQWEYFRKNTPTGEDHPQYNRVDRECTYCGKSRRIKPSVSATRDRVFCNTDCYGAWRSENLVGEKSPAWEGGNVVLECDICGDDFPVKPAKAETSRFCSYKCLGAHHREVRSGEDNPNWEGGYEPYYGPNWRGQRERALDRDEYQCLDCGLTQEQSLDRYDAGLSIHHLTPFREYVGDEEADFESANRLENLATLCISCHHTWEHKPSTPISHSEFLSQLHS